MNSFPMEILHQISLYCDIEDCYSLFLSFKNDKLWWKHKYMMDFGNWKGNNDIDNYKELYKRTYLTNGLIYFNISIDRYYNLDNNNFERNPNKLINTFKNKVNNFCLYNDGILKLNNNIISYSVRDILKYGIRTYYIKNNNKIYYYEHNNEIEDEQFNLEFKIKKMCSPLYPVNIYFILTEDHKLIIYDKYNESYEIILENIIDVESNEYHTLAINNLNQMFYYNADGIFELKLNIFVDKLFKTNGILCFNVIQSNYNINYPNIIELYNDEISELLLFDWQPTYNFIDLNIPDYNGNQILKRYEKCIFNELFEQLDLFESDKHSNWNAEYISLKCWIRNEDYLFLRRNYYNGSYSILFKTKIGFILFEISNCYWAIISSKLNIGKISYDKITFKKKFENIDSVKLHDVISHLKENAIKYISDDHIIII